MPSYKTAIASDAHANIYELLELDEQIKSVGLKHITKAYPTHVRSASAPLQENSMNMLENIEDSIRGWLIDTIAQERGETDVASIDYNYHNTLSQRGILQEAVDRARNKYTYDHEDRYIIYPLENK